MIYKNELIAILEIAMSGGKPLGMNYISNRLSLTNHLADQLLRKLTAKGILTSVKGSHGGYKLNTETLHMNDGFVSVIRLIDLFLTRYDEGKAIKDFWEFIGGYRVDSVYTLTLSDFVEAYAFDTTKNMCHTSKMINTMFPTNESLVA